MYARTFLYWPSAFQVIDQILACYWLYIFLYPCNLKINKTIYFFINGCIYFTNTNTYTYTRIHQNILNYIFITLENSYILTPMILVSIFVMSQCSPSISIWTKHTYKLHQNILQSFHTQFLQPTLTLIVIWFKSYLNKPLYSNRT